MDVATIVVSYNVRELTANCLDSVHASLQTGGLSGHVWVVDNDSHDGSADMVEARFPDATLIRSGGNLGFAGGLNLALEDALAGEDLPRHLLLLNPDTILAPDALLHLVGFLDEQPTVGIAGAQLAYADGSFQHGAFRFPTLLMTLFEFVGPPRLMDTPLNGRYPLHLYRSEHPFAIDHPLGAAMLVRRQVVEEVGLLDTDYFMYCEEIDYCLRTKRASWGIFCVPSAHITHLAGQSTQQFRHRMFVALWRSRLMLFDRYYSRLFRWIARAIVRWGMRRMIRRAEIVTGAPQDAERVIAACQRVLEM